MQVQTAKLMLAGLLSAPLCWLLWQIALEVQVPTSALGADPGEAVVHYLGEWAIRILLLAFSISPLRAVLANVVIGQVPLGQVLARSRRMVGLFAFSYVLLHLLAYLALYLQFEWQALVADFVERAYITAGLAAFVGLLLMAVTSTRGWQRRLGQNWRRLHKLVYLAVALSLIHLWWLTRDGYADLVLYTLWFLVLLFWRWRRLAPRMIRH